LELYSDYIISAFGQITATGLSNNWLRVLLVEVICLKAIYNLTLINLSESGSNHEIGDTIETRMPQSQVWNRISIYLTGYIR